MKTWEMFPLLAVSQRKSNMATRGGHGANQGSESWRGFIACPEGRAGNGHPQKRQPAGPGRTSRIRTTSTRDGASSRHPSGDSPAVPATSLAKDEPCPAYSARSPVEGDSCHSHVRRHIWAGGQPRQAAQLLKKNPTSFPRLPVLLFIPL